MTDLASPFIQLPSLFPPPFPLSLLVRRGKTKKVKLGQEMHLLFVFSQMAMATIRNEFMQPASFR